MKRANHGSPADRGRQQPNYKMRWQRWFIRKVEKKGEEKMMKYCPYDGNEANPEKSGQLIRLRQSF